MAPLGITSEPYGFSVLHALSEATALCGFRPKFAQTTLAPTGMRATRGEKALSIMLTMTVPAGAAGCSAPPQAPTPASVDDGREPACGRHGVSSVRYSTIPLAAGAL